MLNIHNGQSLYLNDPMSYLPDPKSVRGRIPACLKTDQLAIVVGQWAKQQPKSAWEKVVVRHSTKGFISARVVHRNVWLWDGEEQQVHK